MKNYLFGLLIFISVFIEIAAQSISVLTWNICDLGRTKDSAEIAVMVDVMRDHDIIAIQEVVAKDPAGAKAVAKLAEELNRKGAKWDFRVSDPTKSPSVHSSERYGFIWKTSKVELIARPFLDAELESKFIREPYIANFKEKKTKKEFLVVNYHSRKHSDHPEQEIKYLKYYPERFETNAILFAGDYNLTENHTVWNPLYKQGFDSAVKKTPTTLKRACKEANYFNYAIDNIFYNSVEFRYKNSGRIDFVMDCESLLVKRGISDHLPVFLEIGFK